MNYSAMEPNDTGSENADSSGSLKETALALLKPFASLQITIVLFALSLVLVFFGTMAQMNEGIWTVVDKYFRSTVVWIPVQLVAQFLRIFFDLHPDTNWAGSFPFPGGWLLGSCMLANLIAAHLFRFRMTWKRSGIFIIHAGVIVLMISELVTGMYAIESTMTLSLGETSNFVDETLTAELAVSHPLDADINEVVRIPESRLKNPGLVTSEILPVDVEVVEYWKNSDLDFHPAPAPDDSWITFPDKSACVKAIPRPEEAGVDQNQRGDAVAVRVNLRKKGTNESVGQFTLSLWYYPNSTMNSRKLIYPPFTFNVDGKDYTIELRNKRVYLPYSIHLKKFEHAKYEGTETAKDFASTVDVIDPAEGGDREARIWMNNPLRYKGLSYYQLSVLGEDSGTVLQVVSNPGRILPYLACGMVSFGMLLHFGLHLNMFLNRKKQRGIAAHEVALGYERFVPVMVVGLAALWIVSKALTPSAKPDQIDFYDAGQIPVMHNGRFKPIDTVARTTLQAISGRSEVQEEDKKVVASAMQWYIDIFDSRDAFAGKASEYKVFRIDNDQVLTLLQLKPRPEFFRYSLKDIEPRYQAFQTELRKVQEKKGKKLDKRDSKILDLGKKLNLYQELVQGKSPHLVPPQSDGAEWQTMDSIDQRVEFTEEEKQAALEQASQIFQRVLEEKNRKFEDMGPKERREAVQIVQRLGLQILHDEAMFRRDRVSPAAAKFAEVMHWGKERKLKEFNDALASYRSEYLGRITPEQKTNLKFETFFNNFAPFYLCSMLYVMVIILACVSWLVWREPLNQAAFWLAVLTVLLHTFALGARMYLQGRPPVTNLYSSAVFIGWGGVLLCLGLERYYRNGMGNVLAGAVGALTMMMAHFLSEGGDTMEMMQAVLDTNFWLATHVTMVTMGYMATFVAGGIGLLYILRGEFTKSIDAETNKIFGQMLYGVICFATLLSFTGTVLGGLWADYSWGRFWGWDAKENGAVMVVIWNTLILHARWAGLIKLRGIAVLALVGNMITFWSWYGTNQLGAGLHAYGFNTELAERCRYFWLIHIGLIGLGLLPQRYWRSFSPETIRERADLAREKSLLAKNHAKTPATL